MTIIVHKSACYLTTFLSHLGREALTVCDTMKTCVSQLEQEHQMAPIVTELVSGEVAKIFERSPRGEVSRASPLLLHWLLSLMMWGLLCVFFFAVF